MSTIQKVTVEANVTWRAERSPTSKRWIGICEELNLALEADSLDELHNLIPETMDLLMLDLMEEDGLEQYLRDHGWHASEIPADARDVEFEVPWHLIAEGARDTERRAH